MKKYTISLMMASLILLSTACSSKSASAQAEPKIITANEAQEIISEQSNVTILDVRTESEFQSGHIDHALLLPYDQILTEAESILTDKDATILVYCRSGNRSAKAAADLISLGYTTIYDFGGINNWPYEVVTE